MPQGENRRVLLTWVDVFPVDFHILVSIRPGVLVVEAQCMVELVLNDAVVNAVVLVEGHHLHASRSPDVRVASEQWKNEN